MAFDEFERRLKETAPVDACLAICVEEIRHGRVRRVEPGPGRMATGEAVSTFRIRAQTAKSAGITVAGLEIAIARLEEAKDKEVLLFHYSGEHQIFTVFAHADGIPIACIAIPCPGPPTFPLKE